MKLYKINNKDYILIVVIGEKFILHLVYRYYLLVKGINVYINYISTWRPGLGPFGHFINFMIKYNFKKI